MAMCSICKLDCGDRLFAHGPEQCRDELAREVARLKEVLEAALSDRERRCDVCGEPAMYKRSSLMLVGKPNLACATHATELGMWPVRDGKQPTIVYMIRAALRGGPAPSGGGEEKR